MSATGQVPPRTLDHGPDRPVRADEPRSPGCHARSRHGRPTCSQTRKGLRRQGFDHGVGPADLPQGPGMAVRGEVQGPIVAGRPGDLGEHLPVQGVLRGPQMQVAQVVKEQQAGLRAAAPCPRAPVPPCPRAPVPRQAVPSGSREIPTRSRPGPPRRSPGRERGRPAPGARRARATRPRGRGPRDGSRVRPRGARRPRRARWRGPVPRGGGRAGRRRRVGRSRAGRGPGRRRRGVPGRGSSGCGTAREGTRPDWCR